MCPRGCEISVRFDSSDKISEILGFACPRGREYAISECTSPVRIVTSTVRCDGGCLVSVKTSRPVAKSKIFEVMAEINSVIAGASVKIGDVIIRDVAGTGADVIATSEK